MGADVKAVTQQRGCDLGRRLLGRRTAGKIGRVGRRGGERNKGRGGKRSFLHW
jgi:hypothetical protein